MIPILFRIPFVDIPVHGYGLMMMLGFLASIAWAVRRAIRSQANPDVILNCGFIALIAGVVGSRGMYVLHNWSDFSHRGGGLAVAWSVIDITKGGLEFYGGFLLASLVTLYYLWAWKHSVRWYLDIMAPSAVLGLAFGRVGCFLNGCCWGGVCDLPWAVQFPYGSNAQMVHYLEKRPGASLPEELLWTNRSGATLPISRDSIDASDARVRAAIAHTEELAGKLRRMEEAARSGGGEAAPRGAIAALQNELKASRIKYADLRDQMDKYGMSAAALRDLAHAHVSLPVHPAQLYETIGAALLALFLNALFYRRAFDGQVICTLFLVQPIQRWVLETLRVDNPVDTFGMTISQFLAVCMLVAAAVAYWINRRLPPRSPLAVAWAPGEDEAGPASTTKPPGRTAAASPTT